MLRYPSAAFALFFFFSSSVTSPAGSQSKRDDPTRDQSLRLFYPGLTISGNRLSPTFNPDSSGATLQPQIDYGRIALIGGTLVATMVAIHIYQQNGWWKDNRTSFHFREDLIYGRSVDKLGHFYVPTMLTFVARKLLVWSDVPEKSALYYGAGASLLFQTYVEVEDGFSTWGFDRVDFASDVAGAAWPIAQYYSPVLRDFNLKFSYHPSDLINNPGGSGFKGQKHLMFDDYEGQTIWLCFNFHNLLPGPVDRYWPEFLQLAVGYGARDIARDSYPVYFLAVDYDMTKIIPQSSDFLKTLSEALNFIHLPAPAIRFYPSGIWYGLYF